jgi:hypothetical protein
MRASVLVSAEAQRERSLEPTGQSAGSKWDTANGTPLRPAIVEEPRYFPRARTRSGADLAVQLSGEAKEPPEGGP